MTVNKTVNGSSAVLYIEGWLDIRSSSELASEIEGLDSSINELELDLSKLEYISSAGVRLVVTLHKKYPSFKITHASPSVMTVLKMTGLDKRLNIE